MGTHTAMRASDPIPPGAFPSEARAKLAAAIAAHFEAQRSESEAREAYQRLKTQVFDAVRRVDAAIKAVEQVKVSLPGHAAVGKSALGDSLLKDAQAEEVEARDAIPPLVAQRDDAKLILNDAEFRTKKAAEVVPSIAHTVVAEEIEHLLREAEEAQAVLATRRLALRGALDQARDPARFIQNPRVEEATDFLCKVGLPDLALGHHIHPISRSWAEYFSALQEDPNTPAPQG